MVKQREELLKALGIKIKEARIAKGLSHVQLASEADIAVSQVWRIETGKVNVTVVTLYAIADALDVSIYELLDSSRRGI
ncbi:helix-turn-helix domain-containing protein [Pontibacter akesuensis]|uniref:helix-turn-helix domain-containing protein n=1 Tax=Pontibacter akesuensis TaxID=388950 RepID=UPI00083B0C11|nr:helix-turn-helix transcriptional regulator [Pontibacter akesuensis]